jgi:hypothetical protein
MILFRALHWGAREVCTVENIRSSQVIGGSRYALHRVNSNEQLVHLPQIPVNKDVNLLSEFVVDDGNVSVRSP